MKMFKDQPLPEGTVVFHTMAGRGTIVRRTGNTPPLLDCVDIRGRVRWLNRLQLSVLVPGGRKWVKVADLPVKGPGDGGPP